MKHLSSFLLLLAALWLPACGSTPPTVYYALDAGAAAMPSRGVSPGVVILPGSLPDEIDRPQLAVRQPGGQIRFLEQHRWSESLRYAIPRALAGELERQLGSARIVALPADVRRFDADFRLFLEVQRFDAVSGRGADVDIVWRFEARQGRPIAGRSRVHEAAAGDAPDALVAAQRRALRQVAAEMAAALGGMTAD